MVYLSEVTLDPRNRATFRLLADTYALHRWILMAFPDQMEGGSGRVLFRAEADKGETRLLVQGEKQPDWSRCEGVIHRVRGPKDWEPNFAAGQALRFRLRANTAYKTTDNTGDKPRKVRRAWTKRHEQLAWLKHQGERHGFAIIPLPSGPEWFDPFGDEPEARAEVRITPLNHLIGHKPAQERPVEHFGVDFKGLLRVTDPEQFTQAITEGIGPAKGFGFGLLSVART